MKLIYYSQLSLFFCLILENPDTFVLTVHDLKTFIRWNSGSSVYSHCHFLIIWNQHPLKCCCCEVTLVIFPYSVLPLWLPSSLSLKSCADLCDQHQGCPFNHLQNLCAIFCQCAVMQSLSSVVGEFKWGETFFFTFKPLLNWISLLCSSYTSACLMNSI
jgi:hypothetical protein